MRLRDKIKAAAVLVLAAALLLTGAALGDFEYDFAAESLEDIISRYMAGHGMDERNFAMGWYDFETGQEWFFNGDKFMIAGSMYKLPLNMAYTDMLAAGDVQPDEFAGVYTVERAMEMSIVYSDNEAADALRIALRLRHRDYRLLLAQYSGLDETELPEEYFTDNCVSPQFMINTLVYLYDNSELYGEVIGHMKDAHPGRFFRKSEGEFEIAHKYGYYEGVLNDCGIVYTPRPFAMVVFTRMVRNGEDVLSELCALMTDYSLYLASLPEPEPEPEPEPAPEAQDMEPLEAAAPPEAEPGAVRLPEPSAAPEAAPADGTAEEHVTDGKPLWGVYAAACAVLLSAACIRHLAAVRRRRAVKGGHRH